MFAGVALIILLNFLLFIVAPIVVLVLIIRYFVAKKKDPQNLNKPAFGLRELLLGSLMLAAAITGITGALMVPVGFLNVEDIADSSTALVVYIVASMLFLIAGVVIKDLTGKFLMILGIIMLLFSVLPFAANFGQSAGFVAVLIAFIVLVALIVRASRKEQHG